MSGAASGAAEQRGGAAARMDRGTRHATPGSVSPPPGCRTESRRPGCRIVSPPPGAAGRSPEPGRPRSARHSSRRFLSAAEAPGRHPAGRRAGGGPGLVGRNLLVSSMTSPRAKVASDDSTQETGPALRLPGHMGEADGDDRRVKSWTSRGSRPSDRLSKATKEGCRPDPSSPSGSNHLSMGRRAGRPPIPNIANGEAPTTTEGQERAPAVKKGVLAAVGSSDPQSCSGWRWTRVSLASVSFFASSSGFLQKVYTNALGLPYGYKLRRAAVRNTPSPAPGSTIPSGQSTSRRRSRR